MENIDMEKLYEKIKRCRDIPIDEIDINEVDELSSIKISRKKSSKDRILDFLLSTKNPYVFRVEDKLVKIEFSDRKVKAEDCILNVIDRIYK